MTNFTCAIEDVDTCASWASCLVDDYFPCSTTITGNLFLVLVYGYILAKGSKILADGSELLMEILDPGFIGGFLLPVLGALPDSAIIFVSGLSGDIKVVKEEILVGMGTLAGSTIMLLTVAWSASVVVGRCNLGANGTAIDKTLTSSHKFSVTKTGVTCEDDIKSNSRIMVLTSLTYWVIQGIAFKHYAANADDNTSQREESPFELAALIMTAVSFAAYSMYMVFNTKMQQKRLAAAKKKYMLDKLAEMFHDTIVNRDIAVGPDTDDSVEDGARGPLLKDSDGINWRDTLRMSRIDEDILRLVGKWRKQVQHDGTDVPMERSVDGAEDEEEEEEGDGKLSKTQILLRSMGMMAFGTALIVLFSSPMVDVITKFSGQVSIPPFYTSFVITPFVSNASEVIASIIFASKKRKKNISLTFGAIYGAVTMNNTMCLTVFLVMIYLRRLVWEFSAEVVSTVFVISVMGLMTSFRTTFKTYECFISFAFYPLSLGMVAILKNVLGWD
jgi:Ca2+/Na+ antiporter